MTYKRLLLDGNVVAEDEIPRLAGMLSSTGMDVGVRDHAG